MFMNPAVSISQTQPLWEKVYGGSENEMAIDIAIAEGGEILLAGQTSSEGAGQNDFYVVRTSENGNKIWSQTYGTKKSEVLTALSITQDDGALLLGVQIDREESYKQRVLLVRIDKDGNELFSHVYPNDWRVSPSALILTADGGALVAGSALPKSGTDKSQIYLLKVGSSGEKLWEKYHDLEGILKISSALMTSEGDFYLSGAVKDKFNKTDVLLVAFDSNGTER